jgi:hypothetical protein
VPPTVRDIFDRLFTRRRFDQRVDEILDLATRDRAAAKAAAQRLVEWLIKTGSTEPEIEAAIENLQTLLDLMES